MQKIELIRENVNGVEGSFFLKDEEIMECDLEKEKVYFLSRSIHYLTESFLSTDKDLRKISIEADKLCRIFFYNPYTLAIVASKNVNVPLLDMISNKLLLTIEEVPEKAKEAVDEVVQRMDAFIG